MRTNLTARQYLPLHDIKVIKKCIRSTSDQFSWSARYKFCRTTDLRMSFISYKWLIIGFITDTFMAVLHLGDFVI